MSEVATNCVTCGRPRTAQRSPQVLTPGNNQTGVSVPKQQRLNIEFSHLHLKTPGTENISVVDTSTHNRKPDPPPTPTPPQLSR